MVKPMKLLNSNLKRNIFVAALALAIIAPATQALEIKAEMAGTIDGGMFPTDTHVAASGNVDVIGGTTSTSSSVFYHTYGNDAGNFGSRVSGTGEYDITGIFSYKDTITNASGSASAYDFDFTVIPGEISLSGAPTGLEFLMAEYSIDIRVNGATIWDSSANIYKDATTSTFTDSGTFSLGGAYSDSASYSSYMWGVYTDTVALGVLGVGDSLDFEYILTSHAAGTCFGGGVSGFDGVGGTDGGGSCGSIARSGDPFNFGTTDPGSINTGNIKVNQVSEPGSLALMGLGLLGAISARRRKDKTTN